MNGLPTRHPGEVWRVHSAPERLPARSEDPGTNRYDDPRPKAEDRFLVRYMAATIRGCLLESMAWLRPSDEAMRRIEAVTDAEDGDEPASVLTEAVTNYLRTRRVASCRFAEDAAFVDIHAPATLGALDTDLNVQPLLASKRGRTILGDSNGHHRPHLDQAAVLLASEFGRQLTQHCSLAIWDMVPPVPGVGYRSRHDLTEWCWAAYDHTQVDFIEVSPLSSAVKAHREAVRAVAELWQLPVSEDWLQ